MFENKHLFLLFKLLFQSFNKYYLIFFIIISSLISLIFINLLPPDTDMYTHVKLGEIIAHYGILHYDVFSQSASQIPWTSSEWLFEVCLYLFTNIFGFNSFSVFIMLVALAQVLVLDLILRRVFAVSKFFSLLLTSFYLLIGFYYLTARPQIFSMGFFLSDIFILLLYIRKNKNFLYVLLPITYLWTNSHASALFSPLLCFGYLVIALFTYIVEKKDRIKEITKVKMLGLYTFLTFVVTILPPLGFTQYQEVIQLTMKEGAIDSHFISEYQPLIALPQEFFVYSLIIGIPIFIFLLVILKKKQVLQNLWSVPIFAFMFFGYSAQRDTYYGYGATILILGWLISQVAWFHVVVWKKWATAVLIVLCFILGISILQERIKTVPPFYPINAVQYIQKEDIKGNMFNQFEYGGYLAYYLYPAHKIFIDGRTDAYICCQLPDYYLLYKNSSLPNDSFRPLLNEVFKKYDISYVVLVTDQDSFASKISSILLTDPDWNLVWWDDSSEIFVKNDGKNTKLLKEFTASAATPMEGIGYKKEFMHQAYTEYQRMTLIQDSALTRNTLGTILNNEGKLQEASEQYQKAISLNPSYAFSYFNYAQLDLTQGQIAEAIPLYKQAIQLLPTEGAIYIQLWKAYENLNDNTDALNILRDGYNHATNDQQRQIFTQLEQQTQ